MSKNPKLNASGAKDLTAYEALKPIIKEENRVERQMKKLISTLKNVSELSGFEIVNRVEFKHKETGREFK